MSTAGKKPGFGRNNPALFLLISPLLDQGARLGALIVFLFETWNPNIVLLVIGS